MPYLKMTTNQKIDNQQILCKQLSELAAEILGKPESYVMVELNDQANLIFAGSDDPAAHLKLKSLGLPEDKTAAYSRALCELLQNECAIPASRIYIEYSGPARHLWGWNNQTF